jgi:hypothetical protein
MPDATGWHRLYALLDVPLQEASKILREEYGELSRREARKSTHTLKGAANDINSVIVAGTLATGTARKLSARED